jgi:UDP-glucose:(heptosyl)LPS alpha-1,3-glucosyltransferase
MLASSRLKAVIAISKMVADDLVRHYRFPRERIYHIPNGIDLSRFTPELRGRHRSKIRQALGVAIDRPVVLFVGTGFDRKGLDVAIETVARIKNGAELWVIGRDRRPNYFTALARRYGLAKRYRYFGPQADPTPWYGSADVMMLPSVYEPFGLTVLEAMASGLPSVVSNRCGAREIVEQLDCRLVQSTYNKEGMIQALEYALELTSFPKTIERARSIAEQYSLDTMIDQMLALYAQLQK